MTTNHKVIGYGGFGCTISPALKCKNSNKKYENGVSKLMDVKHSNSEIEIYKKFEKQIKNIPNYKDYFLIDNIEQCIPEKLPVTNIMSSNGCLNAIYEKNTPEVINPQEIQKIQETLNNRVNNNEYKIINIPYGGKTINILFENTIQLYPTNKKQWNIFTDFNKLILNILKNAIIPLNKQGIIHGDIKSSNLLFLNDGKTMKIRIIDWGIAYTHNMGKYVTRNIITGYNYPFTSALLYYNLDELLGFRNELLKETDINKQINYVKSLIKTQEEQIGSVGHKSVYLSFFKLLYNLKDSNTDLNEKYNYYRAKAMHTILTASVEELQKYVTTDYYEFSDIWGLMTIYLYDIYYTYQDYIHPEIKSRIKNIWLRIFENPMKITKKEIITWLNKMIEFSNKKTNKSTKKKWNEINKKVRRNKSTTQRKTSKHTKK